eukprot:Blabericola_migrator_1__1610@NODE_1429_length_4558_cov_54_174349_g950_i0_p1_GENE_NODE_1429_length_4558_cov_54_174349_g950_i0NODE_1429_length_4558_cov_54_174349_g950_i0_p1_ORF_typecomplete_len781_score145_61Nrap_D4/PF17405_2/6_2e03Nrap_D4/PF17405_2/8_2e17Nrap/PF03813_14/2e06Nrap_D3/PF17404_2/1_7e05PAP_central/PF04928_17/8_6e02PAP_central/PF04928_17/0_00042Nrap_D5/PF17406_2/7_3e03Nrap_D5/PF17406_2/6_5e03Nrap_D5/PF17406_2/0_00015Nrap_D2/PF17403_2/0_039Nrap_D2/PF17403_2/4_2e03_NODE_1429_length_4558_
MVSSPLSTVMDGTITSISQAIKLTLPESTFIDSIVTNIEDCLTRISEARISKGQKAFIKQIDKRNNGFLKADEELTFTIVAPRQIVRILDTVTNSHLLSSPDVEDVVSLGAVMEFEPTFQLRDFQDFRLWDKQVCILTHFQAVLSQLKDLPLIWRMVADKATQQVVLQGTAQSQSLRRQVQIQVHIVLPRPNEEVKRLRPTRSALKASGNRATPCYNNLTSLSFQYLRITQAIQSANEVSSFDGALRFIKLWYHHRIAKVGGLETPLKPWHLALVLARVCRQAGEVTQGASVSQLLVLFFTSLSTAQTLTYPDPDSPCHDWFWSCNGAVSELRSLATEALICIKSSSDSIHTLLSVHRILQADCDVMLVSAPFKSEMTKDTGSLPVIAASSALRRVLLSALPTYVDTIIERFTDETGGATRVIFGLKAVSQNLRLASTVLPGPDVEDVEASNEFKHWWGDKVCERQLPDGRTILAVIFQAPLPSSIHTMNEIDGHEKDVVSSPMTQALRHLCRIHSDLRPFKFRVESWWRLWDDVISDPSEISLRSTMNEFRSTLSVLTQLASRIQDVQFICSVGRHTNVPFKKRARFMWHNQGSLIDEFDLKEIGREIIEGVLGIEASSKWPRQPDILQCIKSGLLLQLQTKLMEDHKIKSSLSSKGYLDVHFTEAVTFRLRLACGVEYQPHLTWFLNPKLPIRDTTDPALIDLIYHTRWRGQHNSMIQAASAQHPSLPGAIRLVRHWSGTQWISEYDLVEFWELLILHIYETRVSASQIQTPNCAFWK